MNSKPVQSIEFWRRRVFETIAHDKMLHSIIYDCSYDLWNQIQYETGNLLVGHVDPWEKVLDVGCGYGALLEPFISRYKTENDETRLPIDYMGVEISPDLIELARYRFPEHKFVCGDLKEVLAENYSDKHFDWAICRGMKDMIEDNFGEEEWNIMWRLITRVSKRQMIIQYPDELEESLIWEVHG